MYSGVVTSLCFHNKSIIFVGHGPFLKIYNVINGKLLCSQEVLPNNRIHRIVLGNLYILILILILIF